jgi:DNA-directed RNA polymerase subunit RPC12/RpoP
MSSATLYRCEKCNKEFTSLETLREHKAAGCNKKNETWVNKYIHPTLGGDAYEYAKKIDKSFMQDY